MYKNIKVEAEHKRKSGIYKIIINNSFYIGSACNLYQRLHQHKSKLKDSQILEIRKKIKDGVKGSVIALEYNVSKYCISLIKNNKTYSHVS